MDLKEVATATSAYPGESPASIGGGCRVAWQPLLLVKSGIAPGRVPAQTMTWGIAPPPLQVPLSPITAAHPMSYGVSDALQVPLSLDSVVKAIRNRYTRIQGSYMMGTL